jgi:uncharacterized membrane protein YdjX (TVP38/TMEM64 family)
MTSRTIARLVLLGLLVTAVVTAVAFRNRLDVARLESLVASAGALGPLPRLVRRLRQGT